MRTSLAKGWVDENFPVGTGSLKNDVPKFVKWRRPHEISSNPKMFVDGASCHDVLQGEAANCWCMAACSALADHEDLIKELIPGDHALSRHSQNYNGKIVIHLWHSGERRPIEIDDRLPFIHTGPLWRKTPKFPFAKSPNADEFWVSFVEKALAKFHGGYSKVRGRQLEEGLITLTGYSVLRIDTTTELRSKPNNLFRLLKQEFERKSLILCTTERTQEFNCPGTNDKRSTSGNKTYHSFTITGVLDKPLIRVRNPWGKESNPRGKWRLRVDDNQNLPKEIREKPKCNDGEYLLTIDDFINNFVELCIASKHPLVDENLFIPATETRQERSEWKGVSAGGSRDYPTFANNPQFLIEIVASPDDELENEVDEGETEEKQRKKRQNVPVLIELIQDLHRAEYPEPFCAAFHLYQLMEETTQSFEEQKRFSLSTLVDSMLLTPTANGPSCVLNGCYQMELGARYVVVAFTEEDKKEMPFLLRVYTAGAYIRLRLLPAAQPDTTAPYSR